MTEYRLQADGAPAHDERAKFQGLTVVASGREAAAVSEPYRNAVLMAVNDHCVRLVVMHGEFRWHHHPRSDECFLVLEGEMEVALAGGRTLTIPPGALCTVPAGVIHRTRALTRTVALCFERRTAYTDVVFDDPPGAPAPPAG